MAFNAPQAEAALGGHGSLYSQLGLPPDPSLWTGEDVEELRSFMRDRRKLANALGYGSARCTEPDEAAREARTRSSNVLGSWRTLKGVIGRQEGILREKWLGISPERRKEILLEAWSGGGTMAPTHRPDLWALRRESPEQRQAGTAYKDAYMWPQINVEDLSKDKPLLLLLNSRARCPPHVFAAADLENVHVGHLSRAIQGLFLPDYDMAMTGETVDTYGKMYKNLSPEHVEDMMTGRSYKSGDGMDVLEIQERLFVFLVTCCKLLLLLDDEPVDSKEEATGTIQRSPLQTNRDDSLYTSISDVGLEAPYINPQEVDLQRLETIVNARTKEAQDHFWNLRQVPEYFAKAARTWIEHAPENLRDKQGNVHPELADPSRRQKFLDRVIGRMVHNSYEEIHVWHYMGVELQQLKTLQSRYPEQDTPDARTTPEYVKLPEYAQSLQKLKILLDMRLFNQYLLKINYHFASSPRLREHFTRVQDPKWHTSIRPHLRTGTLDNTPDDLLWLWGRFSTDESLRICGVQNLSGAMQHFLEAHPDQEPRVTPFLQSAFADLSIVGELQQQFSMLWPRIFLHRGDKYVANETQAVMRWGQELVSPIWHLVQLLNDAFGPAVIKLGQEGDPDTGRFDYAPGNEDERQSAEGALGAFWGRVEGELRGRLRREDYESLRGLSSG